MLTLVIGGAGSGKSAFAEDLLCRRAGASRKIYLAAMEPFGAEAEERIRRHRAARAGRGFATLEHYVNLKAAAVPPGAALLLEDLGNLCANELFSPLGAGEGAARAVMDGVESLARRCRTLVLVSNEVCSGGADYGAETLRWMRVLSYVNRMTAALADEVYEVSGGLAERWKGAG